MTRNHIGDWTADGEVVDVSDNGFKIRRRDGSTEWRDGEAEVTTPHEFLEQPELFAWH